MSAQIELQKVSKIYETKDGEVQALKDISLSIEQGDIFGIIGMSGAGKSTLVRCLNLLERPTEGRILIEEQDLMELPEKELRNRRKEIAMIFQGFNLLMQKNVLDNVALPLVCGGLRKKDAHEKAREYLRIVGLEEKAKAYPIQLSGGQRQRVAIARALATNPKILLCDEATSALDPQTTKAILELLKEINEKYGITIVIITHEMAVVRQICHHVGIIGHGELVEQGTVRDVFAHPATKEGRELIFKGGAAAELSEISGGKAVRIVFLESPSSEPVIANMVLRFGQPVNILGASTKDVDGRATGEMIIELPEEEALRQQMVAYMKEKGLEVSEYVG